MPLFSRPEPSRKIVTYCPVCNEPLETRDSGEWFFATCQDCRARYTWQPFGHKPKATLLRDLKRQNVGVAVADASH